MLEEDDAQEKKGFLSTTVGLAVGCLACCFLWGSAFPCIKIGYSLFGIGSDQTASQMLFAGLRFTLAGVMVIVGMSVAHHRAYLPAKRDWPSICKLACFQTIGQYVFFYIGLSHASGVTSSIVESSSNFLAILFAALIFRSEALTKQKLVGCLVGFAGVILVNLGGGELGFSLEGEGLVFLSTCSAGISTCLIAKYSANHDPVLLSGWQFLVGGLVLVAVGLLGGGTLDPVGPQAWALLLYMGFISAGAYSLWSLLLARHPVSRVSVFGFMNPVFGTILSAVLLGEGSLINPMQAAVSLALVSAGIVTVNRAPAAQQASEHKHAVLK